MKKCIYIWIFLFSICDKVEAQDDPSISFLTHVDSFNQKRFNLAAGFSGAVYTGFSFGLYNTWYKGFEQQGFHFFDDSKEWNQVDKLGHSYSSYFQTRLHYQAGKWSGLSENKSILAGVVMSTLFQTTIEVFDGFSSKWGFSISDLGANIAGIGVFGLQQKYWGDQRIVMKVSSTPQNYPELSLLSLSQNEESTLQARVNNLYGSSFGENFIKDYNAQTIWLSANISSFLPDSKLPKWLNLAIGYGAGNMFGGFENSWTLENEVYSVENILPRYRQYYLSMDIDFTRIKTDKPWLKTLLHVLNVFKIPSPTVEYNSLGETKLHWLFF